MRTVLTLFPGWLKVARSNLSNLRAHPDSANHEKLLKGDGTFLAQSEIGGGIEFVDAPATASSTGTAGQMAYDADYLYLCVDTDTWVRAPFSTWS
jgi:hypothetical protein